MPYDQLLIENQVCFPLYAASRKIIKLYKPLLDEIGLTYTQYIAMMVLWEKKHLTAKEMGDTLSLDSGTLTPMLKRLEKDGLITRKRSCDDERSLEVALTKKGLMLRKKAADIPKKLRTCVTLSDEKLYQLYKLLHEILHQ